MPAHGLARRRDDQGRTGLHWAALLGLAEIARLLLDTADALLKAAEESAAQLQAGGQPLPAVLQPLLEMQVQHSFSSVTWSFPSPSAIQGPGPAVQGC